MVEAKDVLKVESKAGSLVALMEERKVELKETHLVDNLAARLVGCLVVAMVVLKVVYLDTTKVE
jgi:hypothetical protein